MAILDKIVKPGLDPATLYVCLAGHVSKAGSFAAGQTFRGNHPGPKETSHLWAPANLAEDELAQIRAERGLVDFLPR